MLNELLPAIVGTLTVSLLALLIAVPFSIVLGIYINEYLKGKKKTVLVFFFRMLSAIPSILVGLYGFVMIMFINNMLSSTLRPSLLLSAICLAILISPYIINSTILSLGNISKQKRECALSLGAKKYQNILYVLIPEAIVGIFAGIVLAVGRAIEDTAVIMLTGAAAFAGYPTMLGGSFEALPFFIFYQSAEYSSSEELRMIYIASIILIIISVGMIYISEKIKHKINRRLK